VIGRLPPMPAPAGKAAGTMVTPRGARRIMLEGGVAEVPVYDFAALGADQPVTGPAIVESDTTTVLLLPGDSARMDARGWLEMTLPEQG
ncbi:MAG: hydantoinase/oxoprolinase family protein, partial [Alphaproteobacteria bacterium]